MPLFNRAKLQQTNDSTQMGFWDHLDVLRRSLMRIFVVIITLAVLAFVYSDFVYNEIILAPKNPNFFTNKFMCEIGNALNISVLCINQREFTLNNLEMAGQFRSNMLIAVVSGFVVALPYLLAEIWWFVRPALTPKERKGIRGFVFITSFLFALGIAFGYYLITPLSIDFLVSWTLSPDIVNTIQLSSYISLVVMISLSTGLVFQLPVLVFFLAKMGIVSAAFLKQYRKHAIVVIFILSAVITPPDIFSQVLVSLPLILLYEISIRIAKRVEKNRLEEL